MLRRKCLSRSLAGMVLTATIMTTIPASASNIEPSKELEYLSSAGAEEENNKPKLTLDESSDKIAKSNSTLKICYNYSKNPGNITIHYKNSNDKEYKVKTQEVKDADGVCTYEISSDEFKDSAYVEYYVTGNNGDIASDTITIPVERVSSGPSKAESLTPNNLIMTEINMNDISRDAEYGSGSNDLMEYVELTNPTDQDIKFNDSYILNYCYQSGDSKKEKSLKVSSFDGSDVVVPAKKSAILWVYREGLTTYKTFPTVDEFRSAYGISQDVNVYKLTGQNGLGNEDRGLNLYNNGKSVSNYWWTASDESDGKCVQLASEYGQPTMRAYAKKANLTPGTYEEDQIQYIEDLGTTPELSLIDTDITSIDEGNQLFINYSAKDQMNIKKITVYYKTSNDEDYKSIETTSFATPNKYYMIIPSDKLLGSKYVDYFVVAENSYRSSATEVRRINVNPIDQESGIRSNVQDNQVISGEYDFTSRSFDNNDIKMYIDDEELQSNNTLEKEALFTFSYAGVDSYFRDGITIGNDVITTFSKCNTVLGTSSMTVPIHRKYLSYNEDGTATLKLTLRAGTWGSIWESDTDANNDDFTATKPYLKLTDGTTISPNNVNPEDTFKIGDSTGMVPYLDLVYTIPKEKLNAINSKVDTKLLQDGDHTFKTVDSTGKEQVIKFTVDNKAPDINVNIDDKTIVNSKFTPKIILNDMSEAKITKVTLDGSELSGDYSFNGAEMKSGSHIISIEAEDAAHNKTVKELTFKTEDGTSKIKDISINASASDSANVKINVSGIDSQVSIYKASPLNNIAIYDGVGQATNKYKSSLENNIITSKNGEDPYRIYEIAAFGKDNDLISISADVAVNYDVKANYYVYNTKNNNWEKLDTIIDGNKIKSNFKVLNHVSDGKAKVLVQASNCAALVDGKNQMTTVNDYVWDGLSVPTQYDFSMAWITDTQYYTESWPGNYDKQVQWIVDNSDNLNIKYVVHTGDIVDDFNEDFQWKNADKYMSILDKSGIPYGVLGGNHDVAHGNRFYDSYWKYFGEDRFKNNGVYGGSYKNNLGHYDLIDVDGQSLLMLYMSWDIYTEETDWMNEVLAKYPDRKAIICVHGGIDAKANESYTSNLLLNDVCAKNPNVFAIINGHYHGASINTVGFDDNNDGINDRRVYQICTDYQSADEGGSCYIKMLYFDLANNKIYINSYSPLLDDYNFFDGNKLDSYDIGTVLSNIDIYELNVDFGRKEKTLSVTNFDAKLLSVDVVSESKSVNGEANLSLCNLVDGNDYSIYAVSNNEYGLKDISQVVDFKFTAPRPSKDDNTNSGDKPNSGVSNNVGSGDKPNSGTSDNTGSGDKADNNNQSQNTYDSRNIVKSIIALLVGITNLSLLLKMKKKKHN